MIQVVHSTVRQTPSALFKVVTPVNLESKIYFIAENNLWVRLLAKTLPPQIALYTPYKHQNQIHYLKVYQIAKELGVRPREISIDCNKRMISDLERFLKDKKELSCLELMTSLESFTLIILKTAVNCSSQVNPVKLDQGERRWWRPSNQPLQNPISVGFSLSSKNFSL